MQVSKSHIVFFSIENSKKARRARTFSYNGRSVVMWQHLKIGVKDSTNHTLRGPRPQQWCNSPGTPTPA